MSSDWVDKNETLFAMVTIISNFAQKETIF